MSLCKACVQLAKDLSDVVSAGYKPEAGGGRICHGRPFKELRYSEHNSCRLCWLLHRSYLRENEDEPLDETLAAEIYPDWVREYPSASGLANFSSCCLRYLYVSVRHDHGQPELMAALLDKEKSTFKRPVPLLICASIAKSCCFMSWAGAL